MSVVVPGAVVVSVLVSVLVAVVMPVCVLMPGGLGLRVAVRCRRGMGVLMGLHVGLTF